MSVMKQLRIVHAFLAVLVVASYISAEWGIVHTWLGYGVAVVIAARLAMVFTGARQLGLMRFYPHFQGLKLDNAFTHPAISHTLLAGIAVCLVGTMATGIALDKGRALGLTQTDAVSTASPLATEASEGERHGEREESGVGRAHDLLGTLLILLVAVHVIYLLTFKRPLARFMLFLADK